MLRSGRYQLLLLLVVLLFVNNTLAQDTEKDIRGKISDQLNKIYLSEEKALLKENKKLMEYMVSVCSHLPATLKMNLSGIKDDFFVITSDDGKVRAYYWATLLEKSEFDVLLQFQSGDSTRVAVWNNFSGRRKDRSKRVYTPSKITSIQTNDNKTVYLVAADIRTGQTTNGEQLQAFSTDGGTLKEVPFFQKNNDTLPIITHNFEQAFNQSYDDASFIHLSQDKQKLYIPLKADGAKKNSLIYVFNGYNYVFDKNAK